MSKYARCTTCQEVVHFALDRLGRVYEICPVCHEGRKPSPKPKIVLMTEQTRFCNLLECGEAFEVKRENHKYCSDACQNKAYHRENRVQFRFCRLKECSKEFKPNTKMHHYCSVECQKRGRGKNYARTIALRKMKQKSIPPNYHVVL